MNKASLAAVAFGLLALAACGRSDEDQLNATETNAIADDLDALSNQAANLAAEAEALENQAEQLNQEATQTGADTADEENIAGM
jgi:outer membrane murein-binding lipoprotein Lpp